MTNAVYFFLPPFFFLQGVSPGSLIPPTILFRTPPSIQLMGSLSIQYMHLMKRGEKKVICRRFYEAWRKLEKGEIFYPRFFSRQKKGNKKEKEKRKKKSFISYPQMYSGSVTR